MKMLIMLFSIVFNCLCLMEGHKSLELLFEGNLFGKFSGRFVLGSSGSLIPLLVPEISPCDVFCDTAEPKDLYFSAIDCFAPLCAIYL